MKFLNHDLPLHTTSQQSTKVRNTRASSVMLCSATQCYWLPTSYAMERGLSCATVAGGSSSHRNSSIVTRTCSTEEPAVTAVRHVGDGSLPWRFCATTLGLSHTTSITARSVECPIHRNSNICHISWHTASGAQYATSHLQQQLQHTSTTAPHTQATHRLLWHHLVTPKPISKWMLPHQRLYNH